MKTHLISAALAATLAVTSFAAPAQASDRDVAKVIVGVTALAIIANALSQNNGRTTVTTRYGNGNHGNWNGGYGNNGRDHRDHNRPRNHKSLPGYCAFPISGNRTVMGRSCLQQAGTNTRALPNRCEFTVRTNRGPRAVFGTKCLAGYGYQIARR